MLGIMGFIGMDLVMNCVIEGQFYTGMKWSFTYNFFVKFYGKNLGDTTWQCYIQIHVITKYIIRGLQCINQISNLI